MKIAGRFFSIAAALMLIPIINACALPGSKDPIGKEGSVKVNILVGNKAFTAVLEDNASTKTLVSMLPLTAKMTELNGNEKYSYLPSALPTNSAQVGSIETGDFMLYGSNCLVLFYKNFSTSYSYTRLGSITNAAGLAAALGNGEVQVSFGVTQ